MFAFISWTEGLPGRASGIDQSGGMQLFPDAADVRSRRVLDDALPLESTSFAAG
jgi:hypothetical protein